LLFDNIRSECVNLSKCFLDYVDEIVAVSNKKKVGVLVSGNPLVFSFGNVLLAKAGKGRCEIISGVGCLSVACSRLGVSPVNIFSVSVHGRKPDIEACVLLRYDKIALYTGNDEIAINYFQSVCENLLPEYCCYICKNLTLDNEEIIEITKWDEKYAGAEGLSLVLFVKRGKK
jgi:precorrin-6B methylase 1